MVNLDFVALEAPHPAIAASKGCDALLVNPAAYTRSQTITSAVCIAYR
jgi:hypothetical protein